MDSLRNVSFDWLCGFPSGMNAQSTYARTRPVLRPLPVPPGYARCAEEITNASLPQGIAQGGGLHA